MRICHVTPHVPPDQAANALLPFHLGTWAVEAGDQVAYVAHPPRQQPGRRTARLALPGPVAWVRPHRRRGPLRALRLDTILGVAHMLRTSREAIDGADLVHLHSNGLIVEVAAWLAMRRRKPIVLTLYGTEIWHYAPKRAGLDLFTRAYGGATEIAFYSHGLRSRAVEVGLGRARTTVIYPPIAPEFFATENDARYEARTALGLRCRHLLVNVKRLHPLAGQRDLINALGEVTRNFPDTKLVICGTGPLLRDLQNVARAAGVERHVTFAGLVDNATVARYNVAADAFVLPSLLEACPTVALEALACGTPVVSTDNPGGVELSELFGIDVAVVPRQNPMALAAAISHVLESGRRVRPDTRSMLERDFSAAAVARQYRALYDSALESPAPPGPRRQPPR